MKTVKITEFRKHLARHIDEVLATGQPLVIERKGGRVVLSGERSDDVQSRRERFERFMASDPPAGWEDVDFSLEALVVGPFPDRFRE